MNIPYITYYQQIENLYGTSKRCNDTVQDNYLRSWKEKMNNSLNNGNDSKLGV